MKKLKNELELIRRGLKELRRFMGRGYILLCASQAAIQRITPFIAIHMSGKIITALSVNSSFKEIMLYALIAVFSTLFFDIINRVLGKLIRQKDRTSRPKHDARLSAKALSLDYGMAESAKISELRAKVQENSRGGRGGILMLGTLFSRLIALIFAAIVAFIMISGMFIAHSERELTGILKFADSNASAYLLGIITVLLIVLSVIGSLKASGAAFKRFRSFGKLHSTLDYYSEKVLNENESGKDIRIFNEKKLINEELKKRVLAPFEKETDRVFRLNSTYGIMTDISIPFIGGLVYIYVGLKALAGALVIGKVVEYYGLITNMISSIDDIAIQVGLIKSNNKYLALELEYLELTSQMHNGTRSTDDIDFENVEFEFHNVSFRYPDTEPLVLDGISMKIRAGERLAVVGMNGSGKSTMIKLLCRLYDPTDGFITVNGIDIRDFDYAEYLKLFAVVFQDFKLLAFSVAENVAASDEYDAGKVIHCLEAAGIAERVDQMPEKLDNAIYKLYDKNGIDISGGEEQKIAIARALYKKAPFVILDEPTAALDPIAESEIYARFNTMVTDKTAVYISHRLSSCRFCDRILVFDSGKIFEEGTHDELTALDGKYNELWTAQAQYYK